jgi:hypothetical protein
MEAVIRVRMDNAAFQDNDNPNIELSRILGVLAKAVANSPYVSTGYSLRLRDLNGNDVGYLMVNQ